MKSESIDDRHSMLIEQIAKKQCAASYKEIFQFFAPKIHGFAMGNQMSDALARDLVQEVMTNVWTKAHLYSAQKGKASTWIFTIVRNLRFDLLRKNVREAKVISSESLWDLGPSFEMIDQDANLELLMTKKEIAKEVMNLPEVQKDVICEVYFNGLTQEEYAQKSNLPIGTVKSRIRLAVRKLNNLLGAL